MDDVADLKVMKIKQWVEKTKDSNGEWLLRRPRLTQGCSAERIDGWTSLSAGCPRCCVVSFLAPM
jgi:hypothetical protein